MMVNELYLTIFYRPSMTKVESFFSKIEKNHLVLAYQQQDSLEKIDEMTSLVSSSLSQYGPHILGTYLKGAVLHSELMEFFGLLINGEWQARALPRGILSNSMATVRPFFGAIA